MELAMKNNFICEIQIDEPSIVFREPTITDAYLRWSKYDFEQKLTMRSNIAEVERTFNELALKWRTETGFYSSVHQIVTNTNYTRIKNMGWKVVPFILKDLKREPDHWFMALEYITNENPINEKEYGNMKKMAKSWLKWGKEKQLLQE